MTKVEKFNKPLINRSWSYGEVGVDEYADDKMLFKRYEDKVVVAVMGVTGAGKSSFISLLSNQDVKIGHDLESSTTEAQSFSFTQGTESGFLIDTPGFDDTSRSNTDVLKEVAGFLGDLYSNGIRLNGIIYLHRISDPRMSGSAIKNLDVFKRLCGRQSMPNVILVTTMWKELEQQTGSIIAGEKREEELRSNDAFWANMLRLGSRTMRHTGDRESAQAILSAVLATKTKITADIQAEMIDRGLPLDQTAAGKYLKQDYADLMQKYKIEAEEMQQSKLAAIDDRDQEMAVVMDEEILKMKDKIYKAKTEGEGLRLSFIVLRDERRRSFPRRLNRTNSLSAGASSNEIDTDPRELKELLRSIEEQHKAEIDKLEEEHRSQLSREKRRLGAEAKNVSNENEILSDLVRQFDLDRRRLYERNKVLVNQANQAHIQRFRQEGCRQPAGGGGHRGGRRPPPPPPPRQRPQMRDPFEQARDAARNAWRRSFV